MILYYDINIIRYYCTTILLYYCTFFVMMFERASGLLAVFGQPVGVLRSAKIFTILNIKYHLS